MSNTSNGTSGGYVHCPASINSSMINTDSSANYSWAGYNIYQEWSICSRCVAADGIMQRPFEYSPWSWRWSPCDVIPVGSRYTVWMSGVYSNRDVRSSFLASTNQTTAVYTSATP